MPDVVLVHGLWYRAWSMRVLAIRLASAALRVHRFSYPTRTRNLAANAAALAEFCRTIRTDELHFVGHSLGGLVVLDVLRPGHSLPPGRLVLLGTPLAGSAVAARGAGLPGGRFLLGRAGDALAHGAHDSLPDRETGMIAGTKPRGLGRITGGLAGPNDGTVSLMETQHRDLADRIELPVTHTGMLVSSRVAAQTALFLSHGRFEHAG